FSFDHLVGERKQLGRNVESERLGGLEVNTQHAAAPACEKDAQLAQLAQLAQPSPPARHETHGNDSICETTTRPRPRRSSRPAIEAPRGILDCSRQLDAKSSAHFPAREVAPLAVRGSRPADMLHLDCAGNG